MLVCLKVNLRQLRFYQIFPSKQLFGKCIMLFGFCPDLLYLTWITFCVYVFIFHYFPVKLSKFLLSWWVQQTLISFYPHVGESTAGYVSHNKVSEDVNLFLGNSIFIYCDIFLSLNNKKIQQENKKQKERNCCKSWAISNRVKGKTHFVN